MLTSQVRRETRMESRMACRIVLASLAEARDVVLRDLSSGGAKLLVGDWPDLPRNFYLMLRADGQDDPIRIECDRRWQVGPTVGVRFSVPLTEDLLNLLLPQDWAKAG